MGSPSLYWYDLGASTFNTIGLPNLLRCDRQQFRDVVDAEGYMLARLDRGGGQLVRFASRLNPNTGDLPEIHALMTLDSHLRSGGRVSLVGDSDTAFCSASVVPAAPGATSLVVSANVLPYGGTLASGAEILIQTANPLHYERAILQADATVTGATVTLTLNTGLLREVPEGSVVRQFRTFPTLYMDARTANSAERWLSDDQYPGRIYELDLTLVELPYEVAAIASGAGLLADGTTTAEMGGQSTESLISQALTADQQRVTFRGAVRDPFGGW